MADTEHDDVLHLTDPQAIRAYAHRTRMALVGILRTEGPLTATRAAELTGESVASCSYHLRMLAKYGVVEEVPGPGRQKPWRATAQQTNISRASGDPAVDAATTELRTFLAQHYFELVVNAERTWEQLPREWQKAEAFGDELLYVTPSELLELRDGIDELLHRFSDRNTRPELRPAGAELVQVLRIAFRQNRGTAAGGNDDDDNTDSSSTDQSQSPASASETSPNPSANRTNGGPS
ncbi:helix-turn-helix transcriptional regulator [Catenulispora sp. NF23]|uniref:winged helix-turn-helix domain-containing protein n=1 Tax=Catenulispora pinistramenti TaxID=2705254 RepID=UPI001BAD57F7|nr:helix-turn-helix domain-containing protein [Catenulispora pinistramenti]MBS2537823.1 helix-turn-helix transcriptional regulator [Catenulispora pinistramenti]